MSYRKLVRHLDDQYVHIDIHDLNLLNHNDKVPLYRQPADELISRFGKVFAKSSLFERSHLESSFERGISV